jgi:O-antigen ligase
MGHPVLDAAAGGFRAAPQPFHFPAQPGQQEESSLSGLAYTFLLGFLFVALSRVLDFVLPGLHLPLILAIVAAALALISNGVSRAFLTPTGKFVGLFTLWVILCVPFSQWRGGSFAVLTDDLSRSFLVFLMVAITLKTVRRIEGTIAVIGVGTIVTMFIALLQNHRIDGRLTMSLGQYSNSNDLAQIMLLGMCFVPTLGTWLGKSMITGLGYLMMFPFLYAIISTGSRGALITTVVLAGIVLFYASPGKKLVLIVALPLLGVGLLGLSGPARLRMASLLKGDDARTATSASEGMAIASTSGRLEMLKQSIKLTVQNPLFGVGPGVFQSASAELTHAEGKRAMWLEAHNSYTQVSSETGIPGAIFFSGAVLTGIFGLMRLRKRTSGRVEFQAMNRTLNSTLLGFITFAVTSVFSSVAYGFIFWMLLGIVAATILVVGEQVERTLATGLPMPALVSPAFPRATLTAPAAPLRPATRVTLSGRIKPARKHPAAGPDQLRG